MSLTFRNFKDMEDKVTIEQNGKYTNIKTTDDIRELNITFDDYRVKTLKILFVE